MSGWNSNIRCYVCGGRGHPESECHSRLAMVKVAATKKSMDGRARPAQLAFEFVINGLTGVKIRDRHGEENEIGVFGVVVTTDELRVVVFGDRISFFGAPSLIREFALALPVRRQEIPINWSVDRVSVEGRFAISRRLCRTILNREPFLHDEPEFLLICRGQNTNSFVIRYWVDDDFDEHMVNVDGRNQPWVIPMNVYEHLSRWFGVNEEDNDAAGAQGGMVGAEQIVGNEVPALEVVENEAPAPNNAADNGEVPNGGAE